MAPVLRHCPCLRPENDDVRLLDYSHSNLEDVPNEVFGFERTLEELYLDANQIKDLPRPLFHCHGLRKLNLSDNEVQTLPPAVASLINLEQLDISKNGVLEIPDNIKGCKCLNVIDASVNPLGKLPEGFTQLINLQELYLNDTFLEYLPANFGRLSRLKILELRENHLKVLPKSMARLTELNRLDIGQNDFADLPEVIGNLPRLIELWCDCNNLSCLPPFIGGLKKLAYLDASKNRIYEVAEEIEGCTSLCDLTLSTNRIKELPEGIANLKKLTVMRVDENRLITLPVNIGNLCNLEELVASSNDLEKLPLSIGLLRNLHTLIADDNLLEELPYEMGSCVKLTILSLRDNKLVQIPDELGHITALKVINLSGNLLQYLPFSIAKLPNLQALWLSENQNKPLIPLQSDTDKDTGQKVLTCFMLPQASLDEDRCNEVEGAEVEASVEGKEGRHLIKFAFDTEPDQPSKLVRAPTPYPKELKAHARHARNYALKKQGSKDSEGNEVVEQNIHNTQLLQKPQKCDIPSTAATPDIMIMTSGAPETRIKVKEAIVTKPKSPISSPPLHEKHGLQDYKDKSLNEKTNLQQLNSSDQILPKGNQDSSGDMLATEIPPKVLGRRDSRGDGSSSEKSSTSPAGSPKSTVESAQLEAQTANAKECRFKKNTTATGSKRESWMRQRLLRQGSGDSDRGYRSDHELYLAERDQYGHLYAQHDGYASDWEAFLAKQNYSGSGGPIPMVHQYTRPPSGGELGYRGNAEGQEIQSEGERAYWDSERYYPDGREEGHPDERYSRVPFHQSYWQKEPSPVGFYPYDMSQSYQPSPEECRGYYYPRDTRAEMVSLQPQGYFNESAGYPQAHPWPQKPHGGASPRTLPKRLSGSSPRLKRAQCISVQAPLHSSPQEYHLMPQPPPNIRHPSPGSSPRPGRSPSPRMDSRASAACYPPPVHPKYAPVNPHLQPKYPGHPYPITTQPVNSVHLPPPPQHPPYYGPYEHAASTYPVMPPSPRMKHVAQPYVVTSEDPTQSRSYNTLTPPTVHSSNYYSSNRLSPSNQGEMAGPATIINQYSPTARNAQYGQESEAAREFTYGAVPVQNSEYGVDLSSNLQYHSGPVSGPKQNVQYSGDELGENTAQYPNRPVPSINIIPSTSPPQASYIISDSLEQPHDTWKENSTQEFKTTPHVEENHSRPVSYSEDHVQQNFDLHHVHSVSSVNSYYPSGGSNKPDSGGNLIHSSLPPLSTSSPISSDVINQQSSVTSDSSVISSSNITHPSSSCNTSLGECKKAHYALINNRSNQEMPTKQKNPEEMSEPRMKNDFNATLINSSNRNEQLVVSEDGTNFNETKDPGNENIQHLSDHHVQNVHFVLAPEIRRAHSVPVQDEKNVNVPCVANINVQHLTSSANQNDQLFSSDGNGVFQAVPLSHNSKISPHVSSLDQSSRIKQPVNILPSVSVDNQSLSESNVEGNSKYGKIAAPKPLSDNKTVKHVTKVQSLPENKTAQKYGISQPDKMSLPQSISAPSGKNVHQLPSFPDSAKSYSTVLNDKNICPVSVIKESRSIPLAFVSSDNRNVIQTTALNAKNNKPIPGIRSMHQVANIDEKVYRETVHPGSIIADGKSFHQTIVSDGNNSDSNSVVSYVTNAHATIPVTKNVHTIAAAPGEINKPVVSSTLECINMHHVTNKSSSTIAHPVSNMLDSRNTYPISTVSDSRKLHSVPEVSHNNSHIISVAPCNKNMHSTSNTKNTNQIVQLSTNEENLAHPVQVLSNQNIHLSSSGTTNMLASDNRNVMQACLKYDGAVSTENTKAIREYLCNRNVQSSMPTQNHFVDSTRHYQITGQQSNKQNQSANQEAKEKLIMQMPCSKYIHQQNPTNSSKNTHTSVSNNDNPVNIICTSSIQTQKDTGKLHLHEKGQNIPKSSSDKNNSHAKTPVSDKRFQKVLPPFDKTHHLRPSSARNIPKDDSSKELHSVMEQKFNVPDVTQTDYKKETSQNFHAQQIRNTVPVDENYSNIPPVLPPKPNFVSASNVGQEKSHQSKPPPAIPPKPASMSGSITDTGIQPNVPLDANISTDTVITILPYDHVEHNINTTSKNSTDLSVSKNMQQKGNMPDLLSRIGPEEKGHLILIEDKSNSSKLILKEEMEGKFSKDKMALSSEIITHDEDNNMTNATEDNFPDSPKSPKRNSWFFGAHKNSLVFPVIILKNPGLGFTIEGGIGSPRNPNRPGDNGIYVAQVVTNGPASSALRPGDKILQVDGIDFTRLDNGKASAILQDTGPTVSLMVSRE